MSVEQDFKKTQTIVLVLPIPYNLGNREPCVNRANADRGLDTMLASIPKPSDSDLPLQYFVCKDTVRAVGNANDLRQCITSQSGTGTGNENAARQRIQPQSCTCNSKDIALFLKSMLDNNPAQHIEVYILAPGVDDDRETKTTNGRLRPYGDRMVAHLYYIPGHRAHNYYPIAPFICVPHDLWCLNTRDGSAPFYCKHTVTSADLEMLKPETIRRMTPKQCSANICRILHTLARTRLCDNTEDHALANALRSMTISSLGKPAKRIRKFMRVHRGSTSARISALAFQNLLEDCKKLLEVSYVTDREKNGMRVHCMCIVLGKRPHVSSFGELEIDFDHTKLWLPMPANANETDKKRPYKKCLITGDKTAEIVMPIDCGSLGWFDILAYMQKGSFKPGDNIMPQISVKTYDAVVQAADRQPTTTTDGKLPAQQPVGAKTYNHPASRAHMAGFLKLTSYATFAETVKTICYTDFRPEPALFLVVLILEIRRHPTKDYLSAYLPHLESMLDLTGLDTYMGPDLKYAKDCTCTLGVALYAFLISAGTCDTPTVPTSATFASNLLDLFTDMGFVFPAEVVTNIRERVRYVHTMHRACAQASDREKGDLAALLDSVVQREPSPEHTSHVLVEICRMFPILSGFTMDQLLAAHKYVHDGGDINSIPWSLPIPKYEPRLTGKQAILNHLIVKYGSSKPCRDCKYGITPYLTKLKRCMDFPTITVAGVERFRVGELTPFDISRILKQFNDLLGYQHESLADLREDIAAVSACVKKGGGSYLPDLVHKLCAPRATCDQVSTPDVQKYIARTSGVIDMKKFRAICYKTECGKGEQFWYPHDMYMRCWIALGYAPTPDEYILFVAERYCPLPGDIVKVAGDVWSDYTVVRDLDWIITDVTRQYTGKYPDP